MTDWSTQLQPRKPPNQTAARLAATPGIPLVWLCRVLRYATNGPRSDQLRQLSLSAQPFDLQPPDGIELLKLTPDLPGYSGPIPTQSSRELAYARHTLGQSWEDIANTLGVTPRRAAKWAKARHLGTPQLLA